jgi:2-dehydro-3-deoxyphosphogluconate aldolase / (4S)-4-hydroxy-2-oxoglutarate aldolase
VIATARTLRTGPVADAVRTHRLVAVLRRIEPRDRLLGLVDELVDAGVRILEVTMDAPAAADDLAVVRDHLNGRGAIVGAGTIQSVEQLAAAREAGADFGVSPVVDHEVLAAAVAAGLPFVPGGMTPTEIATAWDAGATFVKLFPASAVGPSFVRELRGPLPEIELIPTGGVDASSAATYLAAGAVAVGVGSALTTADRDARRAIVGAVAGARR